MDETIVKMPMNNNEWGDIKMTNELQNELMYLVIYSTIKKLYANGTISREVFEKLNNKNAERQGCKPILI